MSSPLCHSRPMATKKDTEIFTLSTVRVELGDRMLRAFRRLRDEFDLTSEAATAGRIGLPSSYTHWLAGRRPWSEEGICRVAEGLNCSVAEMLRLAGDGREVAP